MPFLLPLTDCVWSSCQKRLSLVVAIMPSQRSKSSIQSGSQLIRHRTSKNYSNETKKRALVSSQNEPTVSKIAPVVVNWQLISHGMFQESSTLDWSATQLSGSLLSVCSEQGYAGYGIDLFLARQDTRGYLNEQLRRQVTRLNQNDHVALAFKRKQLFS